MKLTSHFLYNNVICYIYNMSKRKTLTEFINESKQIHGNKYDYSKTQYINTNTKVCIICPIHGEFWQAPRKHLNGQGCPLCANNFRKTTKEFIDDAIKIHGNRYDYSRTQYINAHTKVCVICPKHGEFWVEPYNHLNGSKCPSCVGKKKMDKTTFELKARKIHGDKYDYSKVKYVNNHTKVCIVCPTHGDFWQKPNSHLSGRGCAKCNQRYVYGKDEFIKMAQKRHNGKYDYSNIDYKGTEVKISIKCPIHGYFLQTPHSHLRGSGCPICGKEKSISTKRLNNKSFIKKSKNIHGNKYNYSKVKYVNNYTLVRIICPIHGDFLQTPNSHLCGSGCPICNSSKLEFAISNNFSNFEREKKFKWLIYKKYMSLDFYDEKLKIAIECQGEQHFTDKKDYKIYSDFDNVVKRDKLKYQLCKEHNIKLIYFFPKRFLKYDLDFYKDKICFHTIEDLKSYIEKQ